MRKCYADRYAKNWTTKARKTRNSLADRCCCCWWRQSNEVHHAMYSDLLGKIKGREVAGWHIFPLCGATDRQGTCHHFVHQKPRWIRDKQNPQWRSRNTADTIWMLRSRYWLLWTIQRLWVVGLMTIAVGLLLR